MNAAAGTDRAPRTAIRTDTLAASIVIFAALSVVQRLVGFGRGILFCRWLDPGDLGRWDMAMGFLTAAAPLVVLGLPGSLGRYSEHYRQRGLLKTFLRRSAALTLACAAAGVLVVWWQAPWFARLVFGSGEQSGLVLLLAGVLAAVIGLNTVGELFTSLRLYRVNSVLQFCTSLLFAALSLGLIVFWRAGAVSVVAAFGLANLLTFLGSLAVVARTWRSLPADGSPLPHASLWARLMPFALGVWVVNWLSNTFEIVDRYMIIHFGGMPAEEAIAQVGQYHSARVVPMLLISLAGLLAGIIMPHLSHDWEAGRRNRVAERLNLALKLSGFALSCGAVLVLLCAPLLFGVAFAGKYDGGRTVLPLTLTYCTWLGLCYLAERYLWCAEKVRLASLAFLVGLGANILLNLLLLPRFGLPGAVTATTIANLLTLALVLAASRWVGMRVGRGTCIAIGLPATFPLGPWVAAPALVGVALLAAFTDWVLTGQEKRELHELTRRFRDRLRGRPATASTTARPAVERTPL